MFRVSLRVKMNFAKWKPVNPDIGQMQNEPDLHGKEIDYARKLYFSLNNFAAMKDQPNFEKHERDYPRLQRNEIETRILKLLYESQLTDIRTFKFSQDIRRDLKIDSLNVVALLTSIEHEFTTVFQDSIFDGIKSLDQVVTILMRDEKIF